MISVIVSSYKESLYQRFEENLKDTIGLPYEIVKIDNPGLFGICEAYNRGAANAQFEVLCFCHEDIYFKTKNWGEILIEQFSSLDNPGIIGLAGSVYKSRMLSSWWQEPLEYEEPKRCQLIQHFKYDKSYTPTLTYFNPLNETVAEVVTLDGLFLAMTYNTWSENKFDQYLLHNFHGYDLDISLSVSKTKKNYVTFKILIDHFSEGQNDQQWIEDNLKVHQKHSSYLPAMTNSCNLSAEYFDKIDERWLLYWIDMFVAQNMKILNCFRYTFKMLALLKRKKTILLTNALYQLSYFYARKIYRSYFKRTN